jgi:AcrR family transcriptional regulator
VARYRTGIETERRILEATRDLLAEVGLEGTTIKAICQRAAIRPGSLYNLFDSKDEAILTVVREAIEAVDPDPAGEGTDTLAELVEAYITFVTDQPTLARIYLQIAVTGGMTDDKLHGRILRHGEHRKERFADAMLRAQPHRAPSEVGRDAELILATLNGLALFRALDRGFDLAGHARDLVARATTPSLRPTS